MRVLWVTNYPSPYRVDFFSELAKYVEITVLFENTVEQQTHRNKDWFNTNYEAFNAVFLPKDSVKKRIKVASKYVLDKEYDFVVLGDYSTPASVALAAKLMMHRIKYAISVDGAYLRKSSLLKDNIKSLIIRKTEFFLSSSDTSDEYLIHYGATKEQIYRYNFTSLREKDIRKEVLSTEEKKEIKKKLGMSDKLSALLVGRFVYIKGIDFVLNNAKKYESIMDFYIAGDQPTEEYTQIINEKGLTNIHFIGFQRKDKLTEYYQACDLFIFPTRYDPWGLVVNEAMANGMPVLSTDKSSAALHFIKNGINGYVYPVDDNEKYEEYLSALCADEARLIEMGKANLQLIQTYTIEEMALQHFKIFSSLFEGGRKRGK